MLSGSLFWDGPEVVVDPVLVGDSAGVSLTVDMGEVGDPTIARSPPVTASDIAPRPMRDFVGDLGVRTED